MSEWNLAINQNVHKLINILIWNFISRTTNNFFDCPFQLLISFSIFVHFSLCWTRFLFTCGYFNRSFLLSSKVTICNPCYRDLYIFLHSFFNKTSVTIAAISFGILFLVILYPSEFSTVLKFLFFCQYTVGTKWFLFKIENF